MSDSRKKFIQKIEDDRIAVGIIFLKENIFHFFKYKKKELFYYKNINKILYILNKNFILFYLY